MKENFTYGHIRDRRVMQELVDWHNANSPFVVVDLETTGLSRFNDKIIHGVISTGIDINGGSATLIDPELLNELSRISVPLIFHNFKFDLGFLHQAGIDLSNKNIQDTMLMHHLYDENLEHGLDAIIQDKYRDNYKEIFWSKNSDYHSAPYNEMLEYACKDVIYTSRLYIELLNLLEIRKIPDSLIQHVHKLAMSLFVTELQGIKVDFDYLMVKGEELKVAIEALTHKMSSMVSTEIASIEMLMWAKKLDDRKTQKGKDAVSRPKFSFDSSVQLKELVYEQLKLPVQYNNKTKKPSLDDDALEELSGMHSFISLLQEYRGHKKVYGSYIEGTLERAVDGRIYPSFNINGTVTGRISSSNPNLQQLPRNGGIRGIYVPDPGHKLISCDYGMLEVVIAAHFSQDKNLLRIINDGASKHDITAKSLNVDRHTAKTLNFAFQYGCTPFKVKEILRCSLKEAEKAWGKYWETYGGERAVIEDCKYKVDNNLPIINPFGRQRHFPVKYEKPWMKESAYRQAYSALIQGTGADITSRAFYKIAYYMKEQGIGRALFSVHDEIIIMAKNEHCEEAAAVLQSIMIGVGLEAKLSVPLTVDCSEPLNRWIK